MDTREASKVTTWSALCWTPLNLQDVATWFDWLQRAWVVVVVVVVGVVRSTSFTAAGSTGVAITATARASTATMDLNCILDEGWRSLGLESRSQVVWEEWLKALIADETLSLGLRVMRRKDEGRELCLYRFGEVGGTPFIRSLFEDLPVWRSVVTMSWMNWSE